MRFHLLAIAMMVPTTPLFSQSTPPGQVMTPTADSWQATLDLRIDEVAAVMLGKMPADRVFAPAFLAQVSAAQLAQMQAQLFASYGALSADATVVATGALEGDFVLRFARAEARGKLVLAGEAPHQVIGLQIADVKPVGDNVEALTRDLSAVPGTVNAWFAPLADGAPVLAVNADRPLALGSTFKLYVLAALQREIASGKRSWGDVVPLSVKSYPSGLTQDWPAGTPVTVQTLATLMLQISDNTATDQLISLLGREAVEAEFRRTTTAPASTLPFLTTREMFAIKADPAQRARYAAANEDERRAMLQAMPEAGPSLKLVSEVFAGPPVAIDRIEWFASPRDLSKLLQGFTGPESATARGVLSASKGMSEEIAAKWDYVGFKGGSEPGVLNLTWLLRDKTGVWHIASLGWNNPAAPVDQARFVGLANRMLALAD